MKGIFVFLLLWGANSSFAETWYAYCIADVNDLKYCTRPQVKDANSETKCKAFADSVMAQKHELKIGKDPIDLEDHMSENCDMIKGPDNGKIFSCLTAKLCPHSSPKVSQLASRVYADTKQIAIERCARQSERKITPKLKDASLNNCFFRLQVEQTH